MATARRRNSLSIESGGDFAWRLAGDVLGENPAKRLGLVVDDSKLARLARYWHIAVGASAGMAPVANSALHAAPGVNGEVVEEHFACEGAQAPLDLVHAAGEGVNRDAGKVEPFARGVIVALIANKPVNVLGHDYGEPAGNRRLNHCLKLGPVDGVRARYRPVGVHGGDRQALTLAKLPASGNLIVYRAAILALARKPGIYRGAFHFLGSASLAKAAA